MTAYTGGMPTFTAGQKTGNAARLNQIRDLGRAFTDAWGTWTPTITQGVTVATSASDSAYFQAGKLVTARLAVTISGTGTAANAIKVALPVTAKAARAGGGSWWHFDSGVANYAGFLWLQSTTEARLVCNGDGSDYSRQLTSGDTLNLILTYEAA